MPAPSAPPRTLVVIPTYNERDNLSELVRRLLERQHVGVLVVDDASPDGTGAVADALRDEFPRRIDVLHRQGRRGLGRSYLEGFARALAGDAEVIAQMDADLSHDPTYLDTMLAATATNDLVVASRYLQGVSVVNWPIYRLMLSVTANRYIRCVTGMPTTDCTSGFRCWRRHLLERIALDRIVSDGYAFQVEMLFEAVRSGARIAEVPIIFVERRLGTSKISSSGLLESAWMPWRLVWRGGRQHGRRTA